MLGIATATHHAGVKSLCSPREQSDRHVLASPMSPFPFTQNAPAPKMLCVGTTSRRFAPCSHVSPQNQVNTLLFAGGGGGGGFLARDGGGGGGPLILAPATLP